MLISYKKPKGRFFIVGKPGGSPAVMRHISINVNNGLGTLYIDGNAVTLDADNTWEADIADGTQITMEMSVDSDHHMCCWHDTVGNITAWQSESGWCDANPVTLTISDNYIIGTQIDTYHNVTVVADPTKYTLKVNNTVYTTDYHGRNTSGNCDHFECIPNLGYQFNGWGTTTVDGDGYWCYPSDEVINPIVSYVVPNNEIWYTSQGNEILYPQRPPVDANGTELGWVTNDFNSGFGRIVYEDDIHHIQEYTFQNEDKLLSIALPDGMKEVYSQCIKNCNNLEHIYFGTQLEELGDHSFADNISLTAITIPPSFTRLWMGYTFSGCTSLSYIDMQANTFTYPYGDYMADMFAGLSGTTGTFRISTSNDLYNMFVTQFTNYGWNIESY